MAHDFSDNRTLEISKVAVLAAPQATLRAARWLSLPRLAETGQPGELRD
jgi:hypothetical protein